MATTKQATPTPDAPDRRTHAERLYDDGLAATTLPARADGESFTDHRDRIAKGTNGAYQLDRMAEHAAKGDRDRVFHAAASAQDFIDDQNPPDTHPRQH